MDTIIYNFSTITTENSEHCSVCFMSVYVHILISIYKTKFACNRDNLGLNY